MVDTEAVQTHGNLCKDLGQAQDFHIFGPGGQGRLVRLSEVDCEISSTVTCAFVAAAKRVIGLSMPESLYSLNRIAGNPVLSMKWIGICSEVFRIAAFRGALTD